MKYLFRMISNDTALSELVFSLCASVNCLLHSKVYNRKSVTFPKLKVQHTLHAFLCYKNTEMHLKMIACVTKQPPLLFFFFLSSINE